MITYYATMKARAAWADLLSFWTFYTCSLLRALSVDDFEFNNRNECGVRARTFTDAFNSCFTILVAYHAITIMAAVSFAAAETTINRDLMAVVFWVIASSKDSLIPDGSFKLNTNNLYKVVPVFCLGAAKYSWFIKRSVGSTSGRNSLWNKKL